MVVKNDLWEPEYVCSLLLLMFSIWLKKKKKSSLILD